MSRAILTRPSRAASLLSALTASSRLPRSTSTLPTMSGDLGGHLRVARVEEVDRPAGAGGDLAQRGGAPTARGAKKSLAVRMGRTLAAAAGPASYEVSHPTIARDRARRYDAMPTNRLEAFSDGVLAIIITIMVLELNAPEGPTLTDLAESAEPADLPAELRLHRHLLEQPPPHVPAVQGGHRTVLWANLTAVLALALPVHHRLDGGVRFRPHPRGRLRLTAPRGRAPTTRCSSASSRRGRGLGPARGARPDLKGKSAAGLPLGIARVS